jgi:hypothetical protein
LNDALDPLSGYVIVAECITDPSFNPNDWFFPPPTPGTPVCLAFTAITPDGETDLSDPLCVFYPPTPPGEPPPLGGGCISTLTPLSSGQVGVPYSVTLTPNGPADVPQWTVYYGSLPEGLTLNIDTGEISGTPTTPASYEFDVLLTKNGGGSCAKRFQLTIEDDTSCDFWNDITWGAPVTNNTVETVQLGPASWRMETREVGGLSLLTQVGVRGEFLYTGPAASCYVRIKTLANSALFSFGVWQDGNLVLFLDNSVLNAYPNETDIYFPVPLVEGVNSSIVVNDGTSPASNSFMVSTFFCDYPAFYGGLEFEFGISSPPP